MKYVDYIVVGLGIAGISFCEQARKAKKDFVVFSDNQPGATAKSGGILNPTILKFFTAVWKSSEFYPEAVSFYHELNAATPVSKGIPIYRIFSNIREQNSWIIATDKKRTKKYLSVELIKNNNPNILAPLGFGEVTAAIQIDVPELLSHYSNGLHTHTRLLSESFDYDAVKIQSDSVIYKGYQAKHLIFCDGIAALKNPFFPTEKLYGNMGEYVIVHAPELQLKAVLKGSFYIIPLGNDHYKVGATFNPHVLSVETTPKGEAEIIAGLKTMISCDFQIVNSTVGIRPTSYDRNPLIGSLSDQKPISFINGLGSRGFLMAPLLSKFLFRNLEYQEPIPKELDINRSFENRLD